MSEALLALALLRVGGPGIGVIVVRPPEALTETEWRILTELGATPEILLLPETAAPDAAFDFSAFERVLAEYHERGLAVAVTITPHIRTVPWQPMTGPDGMVCTDRQNPFDPVFREEWGRLHREFAAHYGVDARIRRVYVAPPSYFGELEYYMGPSWSTPAMLCYDPLARDRLDEWLAAQYGGIDAAARAWGMAPGQMALPHPNDRAGGPRLDTPWLDLQEWRTDYLTSLVAAEVNWLTEHTQLEVGIKLSVGDYSAYQGADSGRCFLSLSRPERVMLHLTNGHSLSDLRLAHSIAKTVGTAGVVTENDGNRFIREELARLSLNLLLSGTQELNFAHLGHLTSTEVAGSRPTETVRALAEARRYALQAEPVATNPVVFVHTVATTRVRAPSYRNRDVSHVYDPALSNCGAEDAWGYDWARSLGLPDVTSEALIEAGGLASRRVAILPSTGPTLLPEATRDTLMQWVAQGGTLIGFGSEALASTLRPVGAARRVRSEAEADLPDTTAGPGPLRPLGGMRQRLAAHPGVLAVPGEIPLWVASPGRPWRPLLQNSAGGVAAAERPLGRGRIVLFAGTVPVVRGGPSESFFACSVPRILRCLAEEVGVEFPCDLCTPPGEPSSALAIGYLGYDEAADTHRFVGGAYDGSTPRLVFAPNPKLTGHAELLLVDTEAAAAHNEWGAKVEVIRSAPTQAELYADPTNRVAQAGAIIPWVRVAFDLPARISLSLEPG